MLCKNSGEQSDNDVWCILKRKLVEKVEKVNDEKNIGLHFCVFSGKKAQEIQNQL